MSDLQTLSAQTTAVSATYAVAGTFPGPDELLVAIKQLRESGYSKLEAFTPFPIHGIDDALGEKRSPLGYIIFCGGAIGFLFGILLQWWTSAVDYPITIGGKPFFWFPSSIPVIFESTVLFSAFTAVFGMIALNGLPRFYHPIFGYTKANAITDDGFVLVVKAGDPAFDVSAVSASLSAAGATAVEVIEE
jgi:hypothetical protein